MGKSTIQRRADSLLVDNKTLEADNKKLIMENDRLEDEISSLRQRLSNAEVDKETSQEKVSDLEAILKSKDNESVLSA